MLTIKKRQKRSKIWLLPDEEFKDLIKNSSSVKVALSFFGLQNKGNNFKTIKKRINDMQLDISHFLTNVEASSMSRTLTEEEFKNTWLIENSDRNRTHLKKYLIKFDLLEYKCEKCNNTGEWMGDCISLQLEHKNGISNDNRLHNLCFLCPNCHSQTSSFAGKQNRKTNYCKCGNEKHKLSKLCVKCHGKNNRKIDWPDVDFFKEKLWQIPTTQLAKELGVSDKAIERHIKGLGLTKPPRGFWVKGAASVGIEP